MLNRPYTLIVSRTERHMLDLLNGNKFCWHIKVFYKLLFEDFDAKTFGICQDKDKPFVLRYHPSRDTITWNLLATIFLLRLRFHGLYRDHRNYY